MPTDEPIDAALLIHRPSCRNRMEWIAAHWIMHRTGGSLLLEVKDQVNPTPMVRRQVEAQPIWEDLGGAPAPEMVIRMLDPAQARIHSQVSRIEPVTRARPAHFILC